VKITAVRLHPLCVPLPRPVRTAIHAIRTADTILVELETDAGAVGVGYCFAFGAHRARALQALVEDLAPLYRGQDPRSARGLFEAAWRAINFLGHAGPAVMALGALDTACWDLAAQAAGVPLWRYLGATRTRVPCYASSGLWLDAEVDTLVREAEAFVAAGHRAVKMRLGRAPAEDLERVRRVREALPPDVALLADANQGWDEITALRVGRALEPFQLFWLEEPLPYEDVAGYARLAAALDTPIAAGETEYGSLGMRRLLEARAVDVLMPDLQRLGGVTGFLKAAALAEAFHVPLASHLFPEVSAHVLAAAPTTLILEHMDWHAPLFEAPLRVVDGAALLPEAPGIGLRPDRAALGRYRAG